MAASSILVVEDEENIRELLRFTLEREGFRVLIAGTVAEAERHLASALPDLVLLDLMLPDRSGLDFCRRVKGNSATAAVPIVMLTAKGEDADIVLGLEMGADDYITKPFSPRVLVARLHAVFRRLNESARRDPLDERQVVGAIEVHSGRHEASVNGTPVSLTTTEFRLLETLMRRPGWVFTRRQIAEAIHGYNVVGDRAIDVQIVGLRKKLGTAGRQIETVRGVGYRLSEV